MAIISKISAAAPSGFAGSARVDHFGLIAAEPTLVFWGDATTITHSSNAVSAWASRGGEVGVYEQADAAKQPTLIAATPGVLNNNAYLSFSGTVDSNGDRMAENASMTDFPVNSGFTVIDVLMPSALDATRYTYGQILSDDAIAAFVNAAGTMNFRWGDGNASLAIVEDSWNVVMTSATGAVAAGSIKLIMNGVTNTGTPTVAPTTARGVSLGAISAQNNAGLWAGGFAERMIFSKDVATDAFLRGILNEYFRFKYALAVDPFAA